MIPIFMLIGWVVLLIILLYVWADVREIAAVVRETKREMMRSNFGGRTAGKWQVPAGDISGQEVRAMQEEMEMKARAGWTPEEKRPAQDLALKPSEEQILQEVLAEFLG